MWSYIENIVFYIAIAIALIFGMKFYADDAETTACIKQNEWICPK